MGKLLPKSPKTEASHPKFGLPISKFRVQNLTRGVPKYPSPHRKYRLLNSKSEMLCKNVRIFSSDPAFSVFVGKNWKKKLKIGLPNPDFGVPISALVSLSVNGGVPKREGVHPKGIVGLRNREGVLQNREGVHRKRGGVRQKRVGAFCMV